MIATTNEVPEFELIRAAPSRREAVALAVLAVAFVAGQWLRFAEPLGLDQGLFVYFGEWVLRGELA